jgi:hypothetical protein
MAEKRKRKVVAYFLLMPRHLPEGTQESHIESPSILPVYETRFDHGSHAHKAVCLPAQQQHALLRTDSPNKEFYGQRKLYI